ncbi:citrate/2-methylcitrate synthase, partial [Streptomyces galilaeus]
IHGFGHPQHDADPRVAALRSVADEQGVSGVYCALLDAIQAALSESVGRHLPMNIDGISAALLLDLGLDPRTARPILMAPRVLG